VPAEPPVPYDPRSGFWRATGLYNGMIAPLLDYQIAGVIWYQGESNVPFTRYTPRNTGEYPNEENRIDQYRVLFPALIRDWRHAFEQGDLPFLFVQLANYQQVYSWPKSWAEMREAQTSALGLPKTAMAVAADIGDPDNIHAKNKQEVGRRLALAAQAIAYGRDVVYSGPVYQSMSAGHGTIRLRFSHVESGLLTKGGPVKGFEIAGGDHKFGEADANIEGDVVVVHSSKVPNPLAVRYAWADNPSGNLYDKSGLPTAPFRTDRWPLQHDVGKSNEVH
jgi:sialate O-acetylesterase